jgi:3-methyladenine DNA glycosylase AlkD
MTDFTTPDMDALSLRNEIVNFCQSNADEAIVKKYARFFKDGKDGYDAWGVASGLILDKVKQLHANESVTIELLMETAPALLRSGKYEETFFLLLLVGKKKKKLKAADFDEICKWYEYGIVNWAQCDTLCTEIIPWFFLEKLVPLSRLTEWQTSDYRFQRRSVPVSMIKLLKTTTDYTPFFNLLSPLMLDKERVVHQGLGWFLREAWKKQPVDTENFLLLWKDRSARLIFQYATEKMDKEAKLRFRKEK